MKHNVKKRPETFEEKLKRFMKESDGKQNEIMRRSNLNMRNGRKKRFECGKEVKHETI